MVDFIVNLFHDSSGEECSLWLQCVYRGKDVDSAVIDNEIVSGC